jgi:hypothetical protein
VWSFGPVPERDLDAASRVERDPPVFDRLPQHHGQHHDDVGGRTWGQLGLQVDDEGLDVLAPDRGQREVTEAGQDVQAQVAAVGRPGGGPGLMGLLPDRHPFTQRDLSFSRVEERLLGQFDVDLFGADLRGRLGRVCGVGDDGAVR